MWKIAGTGKVSSINVHKSPRRTQERFEIAQYIDNEKPEKEDE